MTAFIARTCSLYNRHLISCCIQLIEINILGLIFS